MVNSEQQIQLDIKNSKTIQSIEKFYNTLAEYGWEVDLAKSIILEFGDKQAIKVANIILLLSDVLRE